jgi:hypothetical protein
MTEDGEDAVKDYRGRYYYEKFKIVPGTLVNSMSLEI